jgi:hypothetical protein
MTIRYMEALKLDPRFPKQVPPFVPILYSTLKGAYEFGRLSVGPHCLERAWW